MTVIENQEQANRFLSALGEQLAAAGERFELVVVGGSGLLALGEIERSTRDVDLVALRNGERLGTAQPLPGPLRRAAERVARDFGLDAGWLNGGPTSLLDFGLPEGFLGRLDSRSYGEALAVHFASRYDQIHFKLYAMVDEGGPGKHEQDLRALAPSEAELLAAARWSLTHDVSEGYRENLVKALEHLGVSDAGLRA
ncbi:MAG: DUF6036 family nucleotidyltransferase [Actinomycetota bacterium]|nr:DUF6036 family nucleotidyltransferase [Actinomycetota bacterium]